ncbi:MAG: 30S ribosomal protein S24e [Candidatus ainarchaeum sp.]|jgi:small subunit ribosomal protein S24e|nr:30S ribosomal protein S24e [Candidatus ainarchaeum sp.]MDD3086029.1 30S ribosomal protein S24e [Candidatus ainarchaeum sp.]MDD4128266.1 30S ribosomal protein S24e [Candidatus ainarchaeum sp.]MDD4468052.1 30S ribosomal protein S24e [Candidatus ainarchaeum sp.]HPM85513.1 30S ribosomal protein S24e [archaeon]
MEVKIKDKKKNELFNRTEVIAELEEKTIPSKIQIREKLSALLNTPVENIAIQKVETKFGSSHAVIYARAYNDQASLKSTEAKYVITRNFGKETKTTETNSDAPASFKK